MGTQRGVSAQRSQSGVVTVNLSVYLLQGNSFEMLEKLENSSSKKGGERVRYRPGGNTRRRGYRPRGVLGEDHVGGDGGDSAWKINAYARTLHLTRSEQPRHHGLSAHDWWLPEGSQRIPTQPKSVIASWSGSCGGDMSCNPHTLAALSVDSDLNKAKVREREGSLSQFMPAESSTTCSQVPGS